MEIRRLFTKVAGVSRRQSEVRRCKPGDRLIVTHERNNPEDPNARRIDRVGGMQLGYLRAELVESLEERGWFEGTEQFAFVSAVTGGTRESPTNGLNILLVAAERGTSASEIERVAREALEGEVRDAASAPGGRPKMPSQFARRLGAIGQALYSGYSNGPEWLKMAGIGVGIALVVITLAAIARAILT